VIGTAADGGSGGIDGGGWPKDGATTKNKNTTIRLMTIRIIS